MPSFWGIAVNMEYMKITSCSAFCIQFKRLEQKSSFSAKRHCQLKISYGELF